MGLNIILAERMIKSDDLVREVRISVFCVEKYDKVGVHVTAGLLVRNFLKRDDLKIMASARELIELIGERRHVFFVGTCRNFMI